ncbi:TetR/AcrR family transcriptional regulator [Agrobacterium rhizogenes]|uniref:TetR/AcrR family transcriptional regulator n=1 Tax=Rhizobium rhizogenes TaxID=359 RepID=UPI0015749AE3|nr:TetR family transcriptional regulator [Rhizobium rhizogenes]NTF53009.1 TetR/AcrR family transcriptional regulator [Rhizobium rhizogenes]NTF65946.1 TetR/AcrR family transcriptional regulator [Rhizobium rhizogenes]NTG05168.1 TetR/AcrR family transcriptional regulator [Rhizobium rhizogenes]NTG18462.1 TetR/AcrR family transcriptional regulator [Rhizobium rhizogenes]NTG25266.1 TetR/AcrR family transcriptional regulator [Rhizobium rhizogenes]
MATTNVLVEEARPPKRRQRKSATSSDNTRDKILDAAEALIGERTYDTVSLREITQEAQVTLALSSYHFGTKDKLFADIVARRANVLSEMRRERLAKLEASAKLTTETILDAFMRPLFEKMIEGGRGWPAYLQILAQLGQTNRWLDLLHENFDSTAELFLEKLATTLPDVTRPLLMRGFSLALVAMLQTLSKNRRIDSLSGGKVSADDLVEAYNVLLKFSVCGLEGLSGLKKAKGRSRVKDLTAIAL